MKKLLLSALSILMLAGCAIKEQGTTVPHEQTQETEKKPLPDVRLLKQDKYDTIKLNATEDGEKLRIVGETFIGIEDGFTLSNTVEYTVHREK